MLASVFRHWPDPAVGMDAYEAALLAFHRALAEARLPGFHASAVWSVGRAQHRFGDLR